MGHLDGHLRVGLLVLGLWSGWFELTASKIVCNFTCINCPTYVSVQPMKVIVEVNVRGSYQSPYLISTYSCPHEIAVSSCGRQFDQRLSATKAGFAIYGVAHCRNTGVLTQICVLYQHSTSLYKDQQICHSVIAEL